MTRFEHHRAHDVLIACKLFSMAERKRDWTFGGLSDELGISRGEIHNSVTRCQRSGLLLPSRDVSRQVLAELLAVAAPRVFYAVRGAPGPGMPTSTTAGPVARHFEPRAGALPVVWPGAGSTRGEALLPLSETVPEACARDAVVYELLALVDVVRTGSPDEQRRASTMLERRVTRGTC